MNLAEADQEVRSAAPFGRLCKCSDEFLNLGIDHLPAPPSGEFRARKPQY